MKQNNARMLRRKLIFVMLTIIVLFTPLLTGCRGSKIDSAELAAVNYAPTIIDLWPVSTPGEQGLDPSLVAELYYNASQLPTIYSLLVFKDGYLVAEDYFHGGSPTRQSKIQSVAKSITSALVVLLLKRAASKAWTRR